MSNFPSVFWEMRRGEHRNSYSVDTNEDSRFRFGQRMVYRDGRVFVFAGNDGTADAPGKLYQSKAPGANYDELAQAAAAVGATSLTVTNGATTITADQFKGGYVNVEDDTGEGYAYRIKSNAAEGAGSAAFVVTLDSDDPIAVATVAATTVGLTEDPFNGVIIAPTTLSSTLVGWAQAAVAADKAGWYLRQGITSALTDGTLVAGLSVMPSNGTAGAVEAWALTEATPNTEIGPAVGTVRELAATGEYSLISAHLSW